MFFLGHIFRNISDHPKVVALCLESTRKKTSPADAFMSGMQQLAVHTQQADSRFMPMG
jgi:hypothetical protein